MIRGQARQFVEIHPPVAAALAAGRPVVALESTIITHGMPFPQNATMAAKVDRDRAATRAHVRELIGPMR